MLLCDVVGRVWADRQLDGLAGQSLVLVREVSQASVFAALDLINAGVGARVLVVTGEPARQITNGLPVDAVISAIVNTDSIAAIK